MKKTLAVLTVFLLLGAVPMLAGADAVPDGIECSMTFPAGRVLTLRPSPANLDRGALCVSDGVSANGAELYIGGELRPEFTDLADGPCVAVIVLGQTLAGDPNWDHVDLGVDPLETNDDTHHDCD